MGQVSPLEFKFTMKHCVFPKCILADIPIELSMYITGFLYVGDSASFRLCFTDDYPYKPPKWTLLFAHSNRFIHHSLSCFILNKSYEVDWSPMFSLEKVVLSMIELIEKTFPQ